MLWGLPLSMPEPQSLMWDSKLSLLLENFCNVFIFQFVRSPPSQYGVWLLVIVLLLASCDMFSLSLHVEYFFLIDSTLFVDAYSAVSCDFGVFVRAGELHHSILPSFLQYHLLAPPSKTFMLWVRTSTYELKSESEVAQSCLTLRPHGLYLPGSSIHGIFQARLLEWVAIFFSRGSCQPRDRTQVSCIASRTLYHLSHKGASMNWAGSKYLTFASFLFNTFLPRSVFF